MIRIDNNSPKSIYEQIYDEFVRLIVSSVLKPDEKLPSVRELGAIIRINPNTIQKAYKLLENDNYIYSQKGKGNYVSSLEDTYKTYMENLKNKMKEIIIEFKQLKVSDDEILTIFNAILKGVD